MNFKDILEKLSQLNEATKETEKGRVHKAEPGGYGRKFDTDEEGDEKKDDKKEPAVKRGRGRPKKGSDETGEVKKYDWSAFGVKQGKDVKLPKYDKSKTTKHSLKEYIEEMDALLVAEAVPPGMKPLAVLDPANKQAGTGVVTSKNPAIQKMLGGLDPKDVQIVMTTQAGAAKPAQGATGVAPVGTQPVSEKWGTDTKVSPEEKGKYAGKGKQELLKAYNALKKSGPHKKGSPEFGKMRELAFAIRAKSDWGKVAEADMPNQDGQMGAGLGAGRSDNMMEAAKPDFIDLDKDGNKKESMKKAASDAKKHKKKVDEGMEHRHKAARHAGKAHALAKEAYNCRYDNMEEVRAYHEGYKEGLDECYGQGVYETAMPATVPGMASQAMPAMEADVEEGNAFTAALAKTPKGGKFTVGGKTFTDKTNYDAKVTESPFAFEAWDSQLNALLESKEEISEGMSVSVSTGQPGMPETVSVNATDGDADKLLAFVKQVGLGGLGNEPQSDYGAPTTAPGGIDVVDDNDGMMALIKKVTGGDEGHGEDYADEEGSGHEGTCSHCGGAMQEGHQCESEMVDEVESEDQMTYEVAEDNAPDSDAEETTADENAEAAEDEALAKADELNEWANDAGKDGTDTAFEQDIEFMTNIISGGLNKQKSTGQTTIPVIAGQTDRMGVVSENADPLEHWLKLSGVK